jgi:CBS domain containing-hemolysin-like protein
MTLILIFIAFVLVLLNGFFVAAEFAIVKLRDTRLETIKSEHGLTGKILQKIHNNLDVYLSACQLGITLASLGLGWIGEPAFARLMEHIFRNFYIAHGAATFLSFITAFFIISFLHIVVGELAPKSLAIRRVEKISLLTAMPLYFFYWAMYPLIWLLNQSSNLILKSMGVSENTTENSYSAKELKVILNASHMHEDLTKDELQILDRMLDFTDLEVGDLMRPIHEMKGVSTSQSPETILAMVSQFHFTRYPIYRDSEQNKIVGVLHIKDLLDAIIAKRAIDILQIKRPILEFELTTPATEVFQQFRQGQGHFAIIRNDVGKYVGFITLDDILSVALGHIRDEFINPQRDWFVTKEGTYILYGYAPLYILERLLNIDLTDQESNTIAGLVLSQLGRMPLIKERVDFEYFVVEVLKVSGSRIELVKILPKIPVNTQD